MPSNLHPDRAFVVQLAEETDLDLKTPCGRVEHVSSGRSTRFGSLDELWAFLTQIVAEEAPLGRAPTSPGTPR